jgi:hypothetical protein
MTSLLAWLDASSEDQRRMREIVRLFSQQESRDELGIGQIRDALSDIFFPGTSTLHTRARYMVFIPWCFRVAAERAAHVDNLPAAADLVERQLIRGIRESGARGAALRGFLGSGVGESLKVLPSTVYWSALRTYGILTDASMDQQDALVAEHARRIHRSTPRPDDEEPVAWQSGAWLVSLPEVPDGFPLNVPGVFELTRQEAEWLQEHMLECSENTLLAHTLNHRPLDNTWAPWADPSVVGLAPEPQSVLDHARRFSYAMHGAALLYNVMLAEAYERAGNTRNTEAASAHLPALEEWAASDYDVADLHEWDVSDFWMRMLRQNPNIGGASRSFVNSWIGLIREEGTAGIADNDHARRIIDKRERQHKHAQARLHNMKLLSQWAGASGSGQLTYRWETVRDIVTDIHDGLDRTDA